MSLTEETPQTITQQYHKQRNGPGSEILGDIRQFINCLEIFVTKKKLFIDFFFYGFGAYIYVNCF